MNKCSQETSEGWNKEYSQGAYQDRISNDREYWKQFLDETIDHNKPLKIIEFGCGVGDYSDYLRRKGHNVTGTDYSEVAIKIAKERYPKTHFEIMDVRNFMAFQQYDVIIAFEVIEHLQKFDPVLYWFRKALTTEGKFIFSLPHKDGKFGVMNQHLTYWDPNIIVDRMFKFWNKISFHKVHSICTGTNIFGTAEQVMKK